MMTLASAYLANHRDGAKEHGSEINGPCPWCGGTDRFIIWREKREGTGKTCQEHNIPGTFWCRQCLKGGDALAYLMEADGMDFVTACAELGIPVKSDHASFATRKPSRGFDESEERELAKKASFVGKQPTQTNDTWQDHATRMARACIDNLPGQSGAFYVYPEGSPRAGHALTASEWLRIRHGITLAMASHYCLGYLPGEKGKTWAFRSLASFGQDPYFNKDGKLVRSLAIPRGITIPTFLSGKVAMLRIRRHDADAAADGKGKYHEIKYGAKDINFRLDAADRGSLAYFIVESELDALLIHAMAGGTVGVVAMRNATNRPDEMSHVRLNRANRIIVSLDNDDAGRNGVKWWLSQYPQAIDYPPPSGSKDHGEAWERGADLTAWAAGALPYGIKIEPPVNWNDENTASPSFFCTQDGGCSARHAGFMGEGAGREAEKAPRTQADAQDGAKKTFSMPCGMTSASTPENASQGAPGGAVGTWQAQEKERRQDIPDNVRKLASLWATMPSIRYSHAPGEFTWHFTNKARSHPNFKAFRMLIRGSNKDVWEWLSSHKAKIIDSRNILHPERATA